MFVLWWLIVLLLLILWRTILWRPRALPGLTRPTPLLLGHRGVRGSLPENSLAAFTAAFEADLDGIEFDVQQSRDGVLAIYHDFELPDGRKLSSLSFAELQEADSNIPKLEQLFELAERYPGRLLNLEVKTAGLRTGGLERKIAAAVKASAVADRVLVSSFNPVSLLRIRVKAPKLRTALLFAPDLPAWLRSGWLAGWLHVDAVHPHHSQLRPGLIKRAQGRNLPVNTWTVNEAYRVQEAIALGVSAVMADDPEALKRAADRV